MTLSFTRLSEGAREPSRAHDGDAGFDLYAVEAAVIPAGERASVGTGIALAIPEGWAGLVLPRSGLAARHGITLPNAPGLIDAGYRGEVRVLLLNTDSRAAFEVAPGDRIAQLVLVRHESPELIEVESLEETVRGAGGFGSSGR
ncbi:MAG TPA: dUTP diphosphatase [Thermoleophilaceae bacterium]|nr:dUTP diphosphatase [Thermoleophilaceae bacterium]